MTKQALIELRDKVAAGKAERFDPLFEIALYPLKNDMKIVYLANEANRSQDHERGSQDAAVAFLEAVLPDWVYVVCNDSPYDQEKCLCAVFERSDDPAKAYEAEDDTPARALLLATLDALIERAE